MHVERMLPTHVGLRWGYNILPTPFNRDMVKEQAKTGHQVRRVLFDVRLV
jgi:hypothetical protein